MPRSSEAVPSMTFGLKSSRDRRRAATRLAAYRNGSDRMALIPQLLPGRANRKALAYTAEIQRLRASGYSFEAIRLMLLEAGVEVSRTTIKREAAKKPVIALVLRKQNPNPQPSSPQPASASASVGADLKLTHPADLNLTRGWVPAL